MTTIKMTTTAILEELKGNCTNFELKASIEDLIELGWYFDEDENNENDGLYLTGEGKELQVCAHVKNRESFIIAHNLDEIGGMEGVEDLLKLGGHFSHDKNTSISI